MPPAQDDDRARQIEALRRYVAELGTRRDGRATKVERPQPAAEQPRRQWLPRLLLTCVLVALALVGGVFAGATVWSDDRTGSPGVAPATQPPGTTAPRSVAGAVASPACKTAVDRANAMLAIAVRLQGELAEYNRLMNDPATSGQSGREVLDKVAPSLSAGSRESARFNEALAAYRQVVDRCKLQTP